MGLGLRVWGLGLKGSGFRVWEFRAKGLGYLGLRASLESHGDLVSTLLTELGVQC